MTAEPWSPLDKSVGALLVARGLVAPNAFAGLSPQQVDAPPYRGSLLIGRMVRDGRLGAAQADELISAAQGLTGSGESALIRPTGEPPRVGGSGVFGRSQGSPSSDPVSGVFAGSGVYGLRPGGSTPPAPAPAQSEPSPEGVNDTVVFTDGETYSGSTPAKPPRDRGPYRPDAPTVGRASDAKPLDREALGLTGARYDVIARDPTGSWEALDRRVERRVELRVPTGAPDPAYYRHARLLAQLDHPAILQVHDVGTVADRPYYSLDRVEGRPLAALLEGRTSLPALLRAFVSVCDAIEHANQRGLVHGHLAPTHVALGAFGQVWVTGWEGAWVQADADPQVLTAAQGLLSPPLRASSSHLAPELRRKNAEPTPRSDVYALGVVLHGILARGRLPRDGQVALGRFSGAPRDLVAVMRQALHAVPGERYAHAAEVRDDVRRFLDGRAVSASRDTLLDALARLRRRYPIASAVCGIAALLVVTLSAITYGLVAARIDRARLAQAEADQRAQEATALRSLADEARATATRQAAVTTSLRRFEVSLALALAGGPDSEAQFVQASAILDDLRAQPLDAALGLDLRARLHRARGDYYLSRSAPPRTERALVEFQAWSRLRPRDAEAHFKCFLAARRLPGAAAEDVERLALTALEGLAGPFSTLGKHAQEVRALEVRARKLASEQPPRLVPWDAAQDQVYRDLTTFADVRWDVAVAHEMLGRYRVALCCPGIHRRQKVSLDGRLVQIEGTRNQYNRAFQDFFRAINLDPVDPLPRIAYLKTFNVKFGLHSPWRYKGGWPLSRLAEATRGARRPEPLVALAEELHKLNRAPSTLTLLERALGMPHTKSPRQAIAPTLVRARLLMARARLASGLTLRGPLTSQPVPSALAGEAAMLEAWNAIASGRTRAGLDQLFAALRQGPLTALAVSDLTNALCDDRADPAALARALGPQIPPGQGPDPFLVGRLLLGRAVQLGRIGRASPEDLSRLRRQRWSPVGWEAGLSALAEARTFARSAPQHPGGHVIALRLWAELNVDVDSREPLAAKAQALIVKRLEQLGAAAPARAFAGVEDPVRELLVRRLYVAPEVWDWQGRQEDDR